MSVILRLILPALITIFVGVKGSIAQSGKALVERKITLNADNIKLDDALLLVAKKCNFNLSYNANLIQGDSLIQIRSKNINPIRLLRAILPDHVYVRHSGNSVALLQRPENPKQNEVKIQSYSIVGSVIESSSHAPVPDATVLNLLNSRSVNTDTNGRFSIEFVSTDKQVGLAISKEGFIDSILLLPIQDQKIEIELHRIVYPEVPDIEKLNTISPGIEAYTISQYLLPPVLISNSRNISGYSTKIFQTSLTPGLSSNFKIAGTVKNNISLNVIGGYSYGVNGAEFGAAVNINRSSVKGLQIAGACNLVGSHVKGVQIGGALNLIEGNITGLQAAGVVNYTDFHLRGLQIAGAANLNGGDSYGAQIASGINRSGGDLHGLQLAAGVNIAGSQMRGTQISAALNRSHIGKGMQLSAGVNLSDTLDGFQLGIVNISKSHSGFQLGLLNIADTISGLSLGLLSISRKNAYQAVEIQTSEFMTFQSNLHMGTSKLYNIFSSGGSTYRAQRLINIGFGLGTRMEIKKSYLHGEILNTSLFHITDFNNSISNCSTISINWSKKLLYKWYFFAGPTCNVLVNAHSTDTSAIQVPAPYNLLSERFAGSQIKLWVGFKAGIRFTWSDVFPKSAP